MDRFRAAFVWAAWVSLTAFAAWYVARFAGRVPMLDDFGFLGLQFDTSFPSFDTLWARHNEHRLVLPRLVSWATARVFGFSLKTQIWVNLTLLVSLTVAYLAGARRIRGRSDPADAFFPLVVLNISQWETLLWAVQINFVLPELLTGLSIVLAAGCRGPLTARRAAGVGACALALPLCGIQGVVVAVPLAGWLLYAAAVGWRGGQPRRCVAISVGGGLAILLLVAAYFVGYQRPPHHAPPTHGWAAIRYAVLVLGGAWGPVVEQFGPADATVVPPYLGLATAVVMAATVCVVVRAGWKRVEDRESAVGMLAILGGLAVLCGGIGAGRGEAGGPLANRYVTLAAPVLCWAFLAWVRFGPPTAAVAVTRGLFLAACVFAWPNAVVGLNGARHQSGRQYLVEHDLYAGVPLSFLREHHGSFLYAPDPPAIDPLLERWRDLGYPPFARAAAEPKLREVPLKWAIRTASVPADADGWYRPDEVQPIVLNVGFDLPAGCGAIWVKYSLRPGTTRPSSDAKWDRPGSGGAWHVLDVFEPGDGRAKRLWVGAGVDRVRFTVGNGAAVRIHDVSALTVEP